mgnify:CR=1 FL=1
MGDNDDRRAEAVAQFENQLVEIARADRVETSGRLVKEQDLRIERHGAGEPREGASPKPAAQQPSYPDAAALARYSSARTRSTSLIIAGSSDPVPGAKEIGIRAFLKITGPTDAGTVCTPVGVADNLELSIVIKADVDGSVEALSDSLMKIEHKEVKIRVIHRGVGMISESDIMEFLADDPDTRVILGYVESIDDGRRFLRVARDVTRRKPVVLVKAG